MLQKYYELYELGVVRGWTLLYYESQVFRSGKRNVKGMGGGKAPVNTSALYCDNSFLVCTDRQCSSSPHSTQNHIPEQTCVYLTIFTKYISLEYWSWHISVRSLFFTTQKYWNGHNPTCSQGNCLMNILLLLTKNYDHSQFELCP